MAPRLEPPRAEPRQEPRFPSFEDLRREVRAYQAGRTARQLGSKQTKHRGVLFARACFWTGACPFMRW